jgi:hypothetical protein
MLFSGNKCHSYAINIENIYPFNEIDIGITALLIKTDFLWPVNTTIVLTLILVTQGYTTHN